MSQSDPQFRRMDGSIVQGWRVGSRVRVNVYNEFGEPVCQCHNEQQAELIVIAVNQYRDRADGSKKEGAEQ